MTSTAGGDDPLHDLADDEKDKIEKVLRARAREQATKPKERNRLISRANEISRRKSRRAHQGRD
jgi:hypothetical protein